MSTLQESVRRLLGDTSLDWRNQVSEEDAPENYNTRPTDQLGRGLNSPNASPVPTGIKSPLTEQSRTETLVTISVPSGATSITFAIASQIKMTDANGVEFIFNYSIPP